MRPVVRPLLLEGWATAETVVRNRQLRRQAVQVSAGVGLAATCLFTGACRARRYAQDMGIACLMVVVVLDAAV